jgi:hypothetical protein
MRTPLPEIIATLREAAAEHERVGSQVDGARFCRQWADRIEAIERGWWTEVLTLHEAAHDLGVPYSKVQKAVANGRIPNVGRKHAPRVRRCDLYEPPRPRMDGPDVAGRILGQESSAA